MEKFRGVVGTALLTGFSLLVLRVIFRQADAGSSPPATASQLHFSSRDRLGHRDGRVRQSEGRQALA